jgi:DNA-binding NtrC family response regulator
VSLDDLEKLVDAAPRAKAESHPRVVVVDDDASIRSSLQAVLEGDYDVRTCKSAVEAVREIDDDTDCVILDVKMPAHDGFWVAEQLRSRHEDVAIIFHSGYQDVKDPYEVINEFRPFGYVVKGASLAALLDLVSKACRISQRVRARQKTLDRLREAREQVRNVGRGSEGPSGSRGSGRR